MTRLIEDTSVCFCGHIYDEHDTFSFLEPCQVEDCNCDMFDDGEDDDGKG